MIIETFICPVSSISNPDEFNTFLLRNQKLMPLSSVGISSVQQEEYYIVFGALSLKSSLEDILLEITSLVDNALIWLKLQKNIHTNYKDGYLWEF